MPDTRPGLTFKDGVCFPCIITEQKKKIDWGTRYEELKSICEEAKGKTNSVKYDCVIAVSGGKDSHFTAVKLHELGMRILFINVASYSITKEGKHNLENLYKFGDLFVFNTHTEFFKKVIWDGLCEIGFPGWYWEKTVYSLPVNIAYRLGIPLVVYGEDAPYLFGGQEKEATEVTNMVREWREYPEHRIEGMVKTIFLSHYFPHNIVERLKVAEENGFIRLKSWKRKGFIDDYCQIDTIGYNLNTLLKWPKFGHARATDVACYWIRAGKITRAEGMRLVKKYDGILDHLILKDFCNFVGHPQHEALEVIDKWYNRDIFKKTKNGWRLKSG